MTEKTALIIGAGGFIGRYATKQFHTKGWKVIGMDAARQDNALKDSTFKYYNINLPDEALSHSLKEHAPDVCIFCAGKASVGQSITDPESDFKHGVTLVFEILNSLRIHSPDCKFIFLSSAAVYGSPASLPIKESDAANPLSPYGFHKLQCEQLCHEFNKIYGIPTVSARIFSAYGPGLRQQVLWDICNKALTLNSVELMGTGKESRDFIHADDVAKALEIIATSADMKSEVYNLGSGEEVTIDQLAKMISRNLRCDLIPQFDNIVPPGSPLNWKADISRIKSLGFTPSITFVEGVKQYVDWRRDELSRKINEK